MNIFCLGINHRTAPIDVRERLWFSSHEIPGVLGSLKEQSMKELVLVSTCNRTELFYVPRDGAAIDAGLWKTLAAFKGAEGDVRAEHFYTLSSLRAVKHLYALAAGIDSMVLGDVQILNQMKEAFASSQEHQCTGTATNRLFHTAFHVGKRARTETEIGEGAVSVSYAAAELASKIFEDLSRRTALLIGAGETGKLTAKHLASRSLGSLLLANRTRQRADELVASLGGRAVDFGSILAELVNVDIVISSVDAPQHIISANDLRQVMKQRGTRPLFIIDIGVPRNIDPAANKIGNVFLNDIDSLNHIIDQNLAHRREEIPKIERIILDELTQFKNWHDSLEVTPTIQQLREQFESIRNEEVAKHLHHFAADRQEEIEILTKRIVNKILHTPMVKLKNGTGEQGGEETQTKVSVLRHLFGLDKTNSA
jgi:glutamyl-tRNA reductase